MDSLVVISGPTTVGKTEVSIRVAERLGCEIVSADSRQVYSEMPIGTAAPTEEQLARAPHHLVRCRSVRRPLNAFGFEHEALSILPSVFQKGRGLALLSGGSMMYVDALCRGIDPMPDIPDELREDLKAQLVAHGLAPLVERLQSLDPVYCQSADLRNPRRVLHALELCIVSGGPVSALRLGEPHPRPFRILKFAILRPRDELYARIDTRVDQMFADGLVDEARALFPLADSLSSLNTVGYRELFSFFRGEYSIDEAIRLIKRNTRHYAKKQITWLKSDPDYVFLSPDNAEENILSAIANLNLLP